MRSPSFSFIAPFSTKLPPIAPLNNSCPHRNARPHTLCKPLPIASSWNDQLFPDQAPKQLLTNLQTSATTHTTLKLHTLTNTHLHAIDTSSDQALPIPLQSEQQRHLLLDAVSLLHFIEPQTPVPPQSAALITSVVPSPLRRFLGLDAAACNHIAQLNVRHGRVNRATVLRETLRACGVKCLAAVVREAPGLGQNFALDAALFLAWADDRNNVMQLSVSAPIAVALAALSNKPCYVRRDIIHKAAHPIHSLHQLEQPAPPQSEAQRQSTPSQTPTINAWELLADDVLNLKQPQLLNLVRQCGIPVRSDQPREQLLRALLDHMCEVQRRELLIAIAAERGRYDWAAQLQAQRSDRGRLWSEMRRLEEEGCYTEALQVAERLRRLEQNLHDVTQDPGTYDRDLDRDEWYRPTR